MTSRETKRCYWLDLGGFKVKARRHLEFLK